MVYNTTDGSHTVLADETSTLTSATLAVHTIQALFRNSDKQMLGLTDEDSIRDDSDSSKSHGLSLGARIGIGIGVTVGGVFLIALGLLLLLMRNRRASDEKEAAAAAAARNSDDPEGRMRGAPAVVEVPPPAYEFSVRNSVTDDDDNFSGEEDLDDDESIVQVDDIEALRAQKAAIQRRIEELESVDAADDRR